MQFCFFSMSGFHWSHRKYLKQLKHSTVQAVTLNMRCSICLCPDVNFSLRVLFDCCPTTCFSPLFLAMPHGMWDLSSLTRDWTRATCSGSLESKPLDCQGSSLWPTIHYLFTVFPHSSPFWILYFYNSLFTHLVFLNQFLSIHLDVWYHVNIPMIYLFI